MSSSLATTEDYKFFDFLAPYVWPNYSRRDIALLRRQVDTGIIQIETLLENALANSSNGAYERIATAYMDFCDGSDAKKAISQYRNNIVAKPGKTACWTNSISISGLANKTGLIRCLCYSKYSDEFYFYAFPHKRYKYKNRLEINLDSFRHQPGTPLGRPNPSGWVELYRLDTWQQLATITEQAVDSIEPNYVPTKPKPKLATTEVTVIQDHLTSQSHLSVNHS